MDLWSPGAPRDCPPSAGVGEGGGLQAPASSQREVRCAQPPDASPCPPSLHLKPLGAGRRAVAVPCLSPARAGAGARQLRRRPQAGAPCDGAQPHGAAGGGDRGGRAQRHARDGRREG